MTTYAAPFGRALLPRRVDLSALAAAALLLTAACSTESHRIEEMPDGVDQSGLNWGGGWGTTTPTIDAPFVEHLTSVSHEGMVAPLRITVDELGTMYVTDPRRRAIHVFSALGHFKRSIFTSGRPLGIAHTPDGHLVVGDGDRHRVEIMDTEGQVLAQLGIGDGEVTTPQDIAVEQTTGVIWVVDSDEDRVQRYDRTGGFLGSLGTKGSGSGQLNFPVGLAIDEAKGEVFVSDFNNARVQVFDLAGIYLRSVGRSGDGDGQFASTQGIALDGSERLYVIDGYQADVSVMGTEGGFATRIGGLGSEPGFLHLPSDAVIDSYGRLLVTSYKTGRIEVWGLDDYRTPSLPLPAVVASTPAVLNVSGMRRLEAHDTVHSRLWIDIAETEARIDPFSVTIAGDIPLEPPIFYGVDVFRDGLVYEAEVRYQRNDLFARYPAPGTYQVPVAGVLSDGSSF